MAKSIDELISTLKLRFHAATDQELADRLSVGRSTVTSWKKRNSVPKRYADLAEPGPDGGPLGWSLLSDLEKAGMQLALLRLVKEYDAALSDVSKFMIEGAKLPYALARLHSQACGDLRDIIEKNEVNDIGTALSIAAIQEFK